MEKRITLFLFGLILSLGTAFGQAKINGTVVSQDDGEGGSRYLVGIGIYFGKPKKKETFIYNSS